MAAIFRAVAFLAAAAPAYADLPVHCLHHQMLGEWEFTLGAMSPMRSSCGHQAPDDPNKQPDASLIQMQGATSSRHFTLSEPDTVVGADGSNGTWTMIYDEGFEVASGDLTFFAFSKFELFADSSVEGGQRNISHCDATEVGWYRNTARTRWGCYVAKKIPEGMPVAPDSAGELPGAVKKHLPAPSPKKDVSLLATSSDVTAASGDASAQPQGNALATELEIVKQPAEYTAWVPTSGGYDQPMQSEWQQSVADALNFLQLGWIATVYSAHTGKTAKQLNRLAGVRRHIVRHNNRTKNAASVGSAPEADEVPSFLAIRSKKASMRSGDTDGFDWRNKDGKNWLTPVVTQGDCGSCYAISTVHMLTARNRIAQKDLTQPSFSVSFPLYCNEYNQGCDGGYGFLESKWNEDVGLVPENCLPFSQGGGKCAISPTCNLGDSRYRANAHGYIGGYYGGSDEKNMKEELVANGPFVVSFEPKEDFMYYKRGVYRSAPQKIHQEWEQVDHAVLNVGYGVDKKKKQAYWTIQNSWGDDWGEKGYFRMARGIDESGCESIAVAAKVVKESKNTVLDDFVSNL